MQKEITGNDKITFEYLKRERERLRAERSCMEKELCLKLKLLKPLTSDSVLYKAVNKVYLLSSFLDGFKWGREVVKLISQIK